jgi:imidazolonepropionase-like amidohydrolase
MTRTPICVIVRIAAVLMLAGAHAAMAQDSAPQTLFTNVHVFNGVDGARIENANVLVEGTMIRAVSTDRIEADGATVIDGGGRTLMPGMIEAHGHVTYASPLVAMMLQ